MSGARMAFALSRDGIFFQLLSRVHPRFRTPNIAILFQAVLSVGFLLLGGNFRQLFTLAIFAEWLSYIAASSTLFIFRAKGVTLEGKYPFWAYPLAPALFIVASAPLLYYTFTSNIHNSVLGTLAIMAGIPVYYGFILRR